ncbi:MAG TPA: hypothetical protein PK014_05995 [Thermoanaerobaculia bacterium]|nr:hypothetical protein [Thermoanaerobaculia bacterium]HUM29648.1 hypothetical protein [Thermoanaerobaculia bacterium]HXK67299.1 hypothetical protein [Thermoanaerobaculia bacterium]
MKRLILLLLAGAGILHADYFFEVPTSISHVYVQDDGSIDIEYWITFQNIGQPIDVVDIGLPKAGYRIETAAADLDGQPLFDIRPSEYVSIGIEVHLLEKSIAPGNQGTIHVRINNPRMIYRDDDDPEYASLRFAPTWFGSQYTRGTTRYEVYFHLPPTVSPDQPRWHKQEPQVKELTENGVVFGYIVDNGSPSGRYEFGVSFPASAVQSVVEPPSKFSRFMGKLLSFIGMVIGALVPFLCFGGIIALAALGIISSNRRKMKYLPATVGVEGVEVRRGLTVPEVAVLKELKVNKVLALVLFGLVRKGRASVERKTPLQVEPIEGEGSLLTYEEEFIASIQDDRKIDPKEAEKILIKLIKNVENKMKGFNRKKTLSYYETIMRKAWREVGTDNYEQSFEWLLLDEDAEKKIPEVLSNQTIPRPIWWHHYMGGSHPSTAGVPAPGRISGLDFAHNIVSGVESYANSIVGNVSSLAQNVTSKTNPVPVSSGGRSGGGGGCACACACAGCACACAGGGR